jgi:hypothetical protein
MVRPFSRYANSGIPARRKGYGRGCGAPLVARDNQVWRISDRGKWTAELFRTASRLAPATSWAVTHVPSRMTDPRCSCYSRRVMRFSGDGSFKTNTAPLPYSSSSSVSGKSVPGEWYCASAPTGHRSRSGRTLWHSYHDSRDLRST